MRTLHKYLTTDLLKVAVMSTAAFTLVMTVIGILEPLRKQGLAAREVVAVLGLTFLLMLSLTLPIATLFAATIVFGRFSQDNEMIACRASGVSTINVLKPALWVGAAVTFISLLLSNVVVPQMAKGAGVALYANMKGVFFNVINRRGTYDELDAVVIRAEKADIATSTLTGVVVIEKRSEEQPKEDQYGNLVRDKVPFVVASQARVLGFAQTPEGDTYVRIALADARGALQDQLGIQRSGIVEWGPLPNPIDKSFSMWSDWATLWAAMKNPTRYAEIGKSLREYRREISNERFAREFVETINTGRPYSALRNETTSYEILADEAELDGPTTVVLRGNVAPDGSGIPVTVRETTDGKTILRTSRYGTIETGWSAFRNGSMVTIRLETPDVLDTSDPDALPRREQAWVKGGDLALPPHIIREQNEISLRALLDNPGQFTSDPAMISHIRFLRQDRVPKLNNGNIALMHFRVSYGASCFLMVAMGAALGLMFRGGQVLVAFLLTLIPAAAVLLMGLMGKEMVRNPDVPRGIGLICIWGGIFLILAANAIIYWRLSKK